MEAMEICFTKKNKNGFSYKLFFFNLFIKIIPQVNSKIEIKKKIPNRSPKYLQSFTESLLTPTWDHRGMISSRFFLNVNYRKSKEDSFKISSVSVDLCNH